MDKLFSTEGLRITVDSLELSGDYRTAFDIGEDLDFTGMQVKALISDGTEQEIPWTDLTIEGYNKNQRGEQTLKLSYKEIEDRLGDLTARGVALKNGQTLKDLYNERCPLYEKYAHIVQECDHKRVREIVQELASQANA